VKLEPLLDLLLFLMGLLILWYEWGGLTAYAVGCLMLSMKPIHK
jgi:hypothetical protein